MAYGQTSPRQELLALATKVKRASNLDLTLHPFQLLVQGESKGWFSNLPLAEVSAVQAHHGRALARGEVVVVDHKWGERWALEPAMGKLVRIGETVGMW